MPRSLTSKATRAELIAAVSPANSEITGTLRAVGTAIKPITVFSANIADNRVHIDDQVIGQPVTVVIAEEGRLLANVNLPEVLA